MKFWDWMFKVLSALVIPLVLWGASLEVRLAVQKADLERLKDDVKTALAIKEGLIMSNQALTRLEEKLNATNGSLQEIKAILRPHS